jgi:hypothetical protein
LTKKFILVYCNDNIFNELYKHNKSSENINYTDIFARLENNDVLKGKPSEDVVKMLMIRILYNGMNNESINEIYYRISSIDKIQLNSIKKFLIGTKIKFNFIIYSHYHINYQSHKLQYIFDNIKLL